MYHKLFGISIRHITYKVHRHFQTIIVFSASVAFFASLLYNAFALSEILLKIRSSYLFMETFRISVRLEQIHLVND